MSIRAYLIKEKKVATDCTINLYNDYYWLSDLITLNRAIDENSGETMYLYINRDDLDNFFSRAEIEPPKDLSPDQMEVIKAIKKDYDDYPDLDPLEYECY